MPKLVAFSGIGGYADQLQAMLPGWEIVCDDPGAHVSTAEILYGWPGNAAGIENAAALKWIQVTSAGVDYIPFGLLRERGIYLTTASGVHANSISESIFGIMLGFSRQLFNIHKDQLSKKWNHDYSDKGGLTEIHGKTIGIIGAGTVGRETARLAKAFQMRTLGFRRSGEAASHIDQMYGPGGLHELLRQSDYVVNILPYTKDTDKLIGEKEFAAMKPAAVYINVGRGKTTDTAAVIRALETKQITAAGLDCVDPEPLPPDSPLWSMDNVFIGSHNSGGTDRYAERAIEIFMANLRDYLAGKAPGLNLVDYDLQY